MCDNYSIQQKWLWDFSKVTCKVPGMESSKCAINVNYCLPASSKYKCF